MRSRLTAALLILVAACAPPPASSPPPARAFPEKLYALGTEPFWSLEIDGDALTYSSADDPAKARATAARNESNGALTLSGTVTGSPIAIDLRREDCGDGMSDRRYPFAVTVRLGPRVLHGCASDHRSGDEK